jgi:hypothetical protein
MSNQQDPPIIVTGGSVTIEFDNQIFTPNGNGKHSNANKKIRRVEVTVNGNTQTIDVPNGKVTVAIHYGNP